MTARSLIGMGCFAALCGVPVHAATLPYAEQYRLQYHFSPPEHWMNDPNGMVFLNGEYHLFYQHNPQGSTWGPMHWGHAVSPDMVHWKNLPIALYPDAHGTIFSGSVVADVHNSSGLGSERSPLLIAVYTSHDAQAEKAGRTDFQAQSLAYSRDAGRTWMKYPGNPVLKNPGERNFRDPKISRFEPTGKWIMTLAVGDHVSFFSSSDLKQWTHESDFGAGLGAHGGVWECPDLIPMRVSGEERSKYTLLVSLNPGGPNGGSGTQYFVGDFDGHEFRLDDTARAKSEIDMQRPPARWVDYGPDDYAGVTWSNVPQKDGWTLFIGWMSNWQYANHVPTSVWRNAMTLPRQLSLARTAEGYELRSQPVVELESLRMHGHRVAPQPVKGPLNLTDGVDLGSGLAEVVLDADLQGARSLTLTLANERGEKTVFRVNRPLGRYELDRAASGDISFDPNFGRMLMAPLRAGVGQLKLHAFVDRSSVELFVDEGRTVMTSVEFPSVPYSKVLLESDEPVHLSSAVVYPLKSIWTGR